jgi:branched-chain amino acid transport system ATP-binding protein
MLQILNLDAGYGGNRVLKGISLEILQGEVVSLIGANGAGKTTLLNCLSGLHPNLTGAILFNGQDVTNLGTQGIVRLGIVQVPENRQLFRSLTTLENLEMGAYLRARKIGRKGIVREIDKIFQRFPRLKERRKQPAGSLSGGEQQMVAIGRALMADPTMLLLDEPSLGLAPLVVREIFRIVSELRDEGKTLFLVEQNALGALDVSQRAYVIENGILTMGGLSSELLNNEKICQAFLGRDIAT